MRSARFLTPGAAACRPVAPAGAPSRRITSAAPGAITYAAPWHEWREIDTSDRAAATAWGQADALLVDGREVTLGPPPSYEKNRGILAKRVARLRLD